MITTLAIVCLDLIFIVVACETPGAREQFTVALDHAGRATTSIFRGGLLTLRAIFTGLIFLADKLDANLREHQEPGHPGEAVL